MTNQDPRYSRSKEYGIWAGAKERCFRKTSKDYPRYGARGITMCDEWKNDFFAFLEYMGDCPEGYSLDRYPDIYGNYEPGNVRWATHSEQNHNRGPMRNNKSGKKGVHELKSGEGWQAMIMFRRVRMNLGTYPTFEEAKKAREDKELELFGEVKDN